jgi:hypothetical protein
LTRRYGRNQRRAARQEIAALERRIAALNAESAALRAANRAWQRRDSAVDAAASRLLDETFRRMGGPQRIFDLLIAHVVEQAGPELHEASVSLCEALSRQNATQRVAYLTASFDLTPVRPIVEVRLYLDAHAAVRVA